MVTYKPWCGIGVRHIQYGLLAVMNCMDFWIQSLNMALYLHKATHVMTKDESTSSRLSIAPDGKVVLTPQETDIIFVVSYVMYSLGRILSASLVLRLSNKYFLLGLIVFENVTGATLVWFVKYVGMPGIAVFLILTSFCRSFHTPLMYNILAKWMPPKDYTTAFCLITIVKEMFSFILSHLIAGMSYLESVVAFMLLTFIYLGWCVIYLVFGAESPQTSFLISKQEWNYLSRAIGPRKKIHCKAKMPLKSILTSCILYAYVVLDFGKETNGSTISTAVQTIAGTADISGAMLITMQAVLMLYSVALFTSTIFIDKEIGRETLQAGPVRKVMTTVGCSGIAITMILTAYVDAKVAKITYLFMAQCFFMIIHTAEPAILFDLSPNYAASIYSILSFARNTLIMGRMRVDPYFRHFDLTLKGPNVTTHIGTKSPDGMIYRYGFLVFFTNLFFIISGNIELKDFDSYDTYDWRKESVISYP